MWSSRLVLRFLSKVRYYLCIPGCWRACELLIFTEASTVPLCGITASWAIIRTFALPSPWSPAGPLSQHLPLVINGGSTCVGSFAIKLAVLGNIHPIINTAGAAKYYVETLLDASKGEVCIDYRCEEEKLIMAVRAAWKGSPAFACHRDRW